jgi:hypothetical protein
LVLAIFVRDDAVGTGDFIVIEAIRTNHETRFIGDSANLFFLENRHFLTSLLYENLIPTACMDDLEDSAAQAPLTSWCPSGRHA